MHHRSSTAKQLTRTADKPKMIQHDVKHVELSIDRSMETMHQKNPKNDDGDEQDEKNASAVSVIKTAIETGVQKVVMSDITAVGRQMLLTQQLLEQVGGRRLSDERYWVRSEKQEMMDEPTNKQTNKRCMKVILSERVSTIAICMVLSVSVRLIQI